MACTCARVGWRKARRAWLAFTVRVKAHRPRWPSAGGHCRATSGVDQELSCRELCSATRKQAHPTQRNSEAEEQEFCKMCETYKRCCASYERHIVVNRPTSRFERPAQTDRPQGGSGRRPRRTADRRGGPVGRSADRGGGRSGWLEGHTAHARRSCE